MSEQSQSRQSDSVLCRYNLGTSQHTPEIDIHRGGLATATSSSASGAARGGPGHTAHADILDLVRTFEHWDVSKNNRNKHAKVNTVYPGYNLHASRDPNPVLCA